MSIRSFNKSTANHVLRQIENAVDAVLRTHGLVRPSSARGRYRADHMKVTFEIATVGPDGVAKDPTAVDFKAHAHKYGLRPDDLMRTFDHKGQSFRIVGLVPRRSVRPIQCLAVDGSTFRFPPAIVCASLGLPAPRERRRQGGPDTVFAEVGFKTYPSRSSTLPLKRRIAWASTMGDFDSQLDVARRSYNTMTVCVNQTTKTVSAII